MKPTSAKVSLYRILRLVVALVWACLSASVLSRAQQPAAQEACQLLRVAPAAGAKIFDTPQQAADALVDAAEKFDVAALDADLRSRRQGRRLQRRIRAGPEACR